MVWFPSSFKRIDGNVSETPGCPLPTHWSLWSTQSRVEPSPQLANQCHSRRLRACAIQHLDWQHSSSLDIHRILVLLFLIKYFHSTYLWRRLRSKVGSWCRRNLGQHWGWRAACSFFRTCQKVLVEKENQLNFMQKTFEENGDGSSVGVIIEVLSAPQIKLKYMFKLMPGAGTQIKQVVTRLDAPVHTF